MGIVIQSKFMTKEQFIKYLNSSSQETLDAFAFKSTMNKEYLQFLVLLISKRLVNNPKNRVGQSLLHTSVIHNNIETLRFLVDSGLNINETDDDYRTPLHLSVVYPVDVNIVSYLISNEADVNAKTERLETPLFLACQSNNTDAVRILLETNKCDISFPNDLGQEAMFIAYKNDNKEILRLLKKFKEAV